MNLTKLFIATISAVILSTSPNVFQQIGNTQPTTKVPTNATINASNSRNWAGYATTNGTFTGVGGTWTIPTSTTSNSNRGTDATWVGIGGVHNEDLIQAGTQEAVSPNGEIQYSAFYEALPQASQPLPVTVNGGDSVTVAITDNTNNSWHIAFKDNTNGKSSDITVPYTSSHSSADWIEEAPSTTRRILPIDNFGTVQFSNAWAITNGQKKTIAQTNPQAITMGGPYGQTLAVASTLAGDGASFRVRRTNTSSGQAASEDKSGISEYRSQRSTPYVIRVRRSFRFR